MYRPEEACGLWVDAYKPSTDLILVFFIAMYLSYFNVLHNIQLLLLNLLYKFDRPIG